MSKRARTTSEPGSGRTPSRPAPRPRAGRGPGGPTGVQLGEATARALVLEGATRVFAERGVRDVTVEDLLTAAGVSRRTFYRLYADKEAVALALYQLGTAGLLSAATAAMADEADRIKKLERCVDAHLTNARVFGRLVFVLGGEAQRQESPLHPRRRATHDALVAMLAQGAPEVPALTLRAAVVAVEAVTRMALEACDEGRNVRDEVLDEARAFLLRMAEAVLA